MSCSNMFLHEKKLLKNIPIFEYEIHLWYTYYEDIHDENLLSNYRLMLSKEECYKLEHFSFEEHRKQFLITRAAVRSILSLYEPAIPTYAWEFKNNAYGKPYLNNPSVLPLQFSVSHADKLIVIAVTIGQEVGVDVEYICRSNDILKLADSCFSSAEVKQLFDLSIVDRKNRFLDLWTLKEAYIKACGLGLSIPLNHFSFLFSEQGEISINFQPERKDNPSHWQFWQIKPSCDYKIAVAIKNFDINKALSLSERAIVPLSLIKDVNYHKAHMRLC